MCRQLLTATALGLAFCAATALVGCSPGGDLEQSVGLSPTPAPLVSADEPAVSTESVADGLTQTTQRNAVELLEGVGEVPAVLALGELLSVASTACPDGDAHQLRLWTTPRAGAGTPVLETPFLGTGPERVARLRVPSEWDTSDGAVLEISCELDGARGWSEFSIALRSPITTPRPSES